jgi:hypothetical protein
MLSPLDEKELGKPRSCGTSAGVDRLPYEVDKFDDAIARLNARLKELGVELKDAQPMSRPLQVPPAVETGHVEQHAQFSVLQDESANSGTKCP